MVRKILAGFLVLTAVSLAPAGAWAADEKKSDAQQAVLPMEAQQRVNRQPSAAEMQQLMGPMMGEMMSSMLRSMSKTMADPQIAENFAVFTRNYFKALVAQGFSEEEAMKIVMNSGLPSMGGGK